MRGAASGSSSSPYVSPDERRRFFNVWRVDEEAGVMEEEIVWLMSILEWTAFESGLYVIIRQ